MITSPGPDKICPTVAVTRCSDYQADKIAEAVERQFSLLGGLERFISKGDTVLLKPNFIVACPQSQAAVTDPAVILAVAKLVKDFGGRPFVGDSPAWSNMAKCVSDLELEEPLKKLGVPFQQLNKIKRYKIAGARVGISRVAMEADKIINLPKFKAHQQLVATFAVKNMFGAVCGKEKVFWHFAKGKSHDNFCRMLIGIYQLLNPVLTIVDGVVAMEGMGPISGSPKPLGFLVGSADPVACEAICCELIDFKLDELPIIQTAKRIGFGCSDMSRIKVVGDDYSDFVCKDFQHAEQRPLNYSLGHVCKSVSKQLVILAKSALNCDRDQRKNL